MSICKGCGAELSATTGFLHDCSGIESGEQITKTAQGILREFANSTKMWEEINAVGNSDQSLSHDIHAAFTFSQRAFTDNLGSPGPSDVLTANLYSVLAFAAMALSKITEIEKGGS